MAKERFERSKPHVNIGTNSGIIDDSSGTLLSDDAASQAAGNPAPSSVLSFNADASSTLQTATVAFPIDDVFQFDPKSSGDAISIDFQLDAIVTNLAGAPDVDVALAIIQDEPFLARVSADALEPTDTSWTSISQTGLTAGDFAAVDGGRELPDFSRPFQFGYAFSGEYSTTALDVDLGLDNMVVEITTVPEPSTMLLAASMGASLLWSRWWGGNNELD